MKVRAHFTCGGALPLLLALHCTLSFAQEAPPVGGEKTTYSPAQGLYSVRYPVAWERKESTESGQQQATFTAPEGRLWATIIDKPAHGQSLSQFYEELVAPLRNQYKEEVNILEPYTKEEGTLTWLYGRTVVQANNARAIRKYSLVAKDDHLFAVVIGVRLDGPKITDAELADLNGVVNTFALVPAPPAASQQPGPTVLSETKPKLIPKVTVRQSIKAPAKAPFTIAPFPYTKLNYEPESVKITDGKRTLERVVVTLQPDAILPPNSFELTPLHLLKLSPTQAGHSLLVEYRYQPQRIALYCSDEVAAVMEPILKRVGDVAVHGLEVQALLKECVDHKRMTIEELQSKLGCTKIMGITREIEKENDFYWDGQYLRWRVYLTVEVTILDIQSGETIFKESLSGNFSVGKARGLTKPILENTAKYLSVILGI